MTDCENEGNGTSSPDIFLIVIVEGGGAAGESSRRESTV